MIEELKHISQFLIEFIEKNYDKLDDTFKTLGLEYKEPLSKDLLTSKLRFSEDVDMDKWMLDVSWSFTEGLKECCDEDYLDNLFVYEDTNCDSSVYKLNERYIRHSVGRKFEDYFQFVEKKTKLVEYFE